MKFGFLREKSIFAAFKTQAPPEEIMAVIHEASADNISYKQYAPKKIAKAQLKESRTKNLTRILAKRSLKVESMLYKNYF